MRASTVMRQPPRKLRGQGVGPRTIDGTIMDLRHGAFFLGMKEKMLRARVARGTVPFRRLGGRIIFLKSELQQFLESLDGVNLHQALVNLKIRAGGSADDGALTGTPLVVPQARA